MITASIVSHGHGELVDRFIDDLIQHQSPALTRLILTLNIAEPEPASLAAARFAVTVRRNAAPFGFGTNHNRAFESCDTPWFAILNPDLRAETDLFSPLLAACEPSDALLAPRIAEPAGDAADAVRVLPTPWQVLRRSLGTRAAADLCRADWIAGMFMLARSDAFRAVGGFDERYRLYCEDVDLCLRLKLAGWRIRVVPSVLVRHAAQRASHRRTKYLYWHVASLLRLWRSPVFWRYLRRRRGLRGVISGSAPRGASGEEFGPGTGTERRS